MLAIAIIIHGSQNLACIVRQHKPKHSHVYPQTFKSGYCQQNLLWMLSACLFSQAGETCWSL
jgi:hypothetical protein